MQMDQADGGLQMEIIEDCQRSGREILDSRGNPTVEVDVTLEGGARGRAGVPSGASTGEREALELRDGDKSRYLGKGVKKAVANINGEIAAAIKGKELTQRALDEAMIALDGTPTKSRLGANALLGVSMAALRADAARAGKPLYVHIAALAGNTSGYVLPVPMMNILNGGAHADSNVDFQEFMVMPIGFPSFSEGLRAGTEIFHALRSILKGRKLSTGVGDEGGLCAKPQVQSRSARRGDGSNRQGGRQGRRERVHRPRRGGQRILGGNDRYEFKKSGEPARDSQGMVDLYVDWCRQYPIISIEDGCAEQDWKGWKLLTEALGQKVQLVGDDVFVTNPSILKEGISAGIAQCGAGEGQPDRHGHRDARRDGDRQPGRLSLRGVASLG